ncbi:MAG: TetR/AcrR family transcriptional regulator [Acetobacter sp.]|nr:TetR/AcrR family transcriptional regulator [Acetobacter sp.]MCH4060123.1 TetR/AcrR family transcriptional regulator [Acetobacter sp.]MCH4087063.1 TetR/AcrR family transcriptional regulator [Acetobacter sp.]MCI1292883.1 TetR/AcrR family transcriptional regulator [Acetobacter sp.]MCI1319469.1 TetR/AcrR family transcriptional regulator [Acetobacter sp.]
MPKIFAATVAENYDYMADILTCAFEACLVETAYEAMTLADVARRAGIARNTIYNYVANKDDLLDLAVERTGLALSDVVADLMGSRAAARDRLVTLIDGIFHNVAKGKHLAITSCLIAVSGGRPESLPPSMRYVRDCFENILVDGFVKGEFQQSGELTLELIVGVLRAAATHILRLPHDVSQVRSEVVDMVLGYLSEERGHVPDYSAHQVEGGGKMKRDAANE